MAGDGDDDDSLVSVHLSYSLSEAQVIVSMLQAYGIPAIIQGGESARNYGEVAITAGGMPILVPQRNLRDAKQLVQEFKDA